MTLEETIIERSPCGAVTTQDCPGGWLGIVAKYGGDAWVQYAKANDAPEHVAILKARAGRWLDNKRYPACPASEALFTRMG